MGWNEGTSFEGTRENERKSKHNMMAAASSKTTTKMSANTILKSKLRRSQAEDLKRSEDKYDLNDVHDGSDSVELNSVDNSTEEENSSESEDDDENEFEDDDSISEDDNAVGQDWMDVDDHDEDNDLSSSDDDEADEGIKHTETESGDPKLHGNAGWADAMAKILRTSKPKGKKSIVLAKAKKLSQITASRTSTEVKEDYGFEIDGEVEEKEVKPKVEEMDVKPDLVHMKAKPRRRALLAEGKVKPSFLHRERERALSKIATKGVVQLFNAVREQQKDISSKLKEANGSVRKEEKILKSIDKRAFLDVLMGKARSEKVEDNVRIKKQEVKTESEEAEKPATWNVLRDNFLTGSNLKDWDKCGEIKLESDIDEVELN
ncbi:RRP15-like protein [Frankliniella fusca]|uniref:RRP15-like protein n=1 Tax=Frankliniella fusca TaxID=407009 RepID=A0AAE1LAA0_9NEOP|nr:RRP15-like protein [Frankliniella fusca]